MTSHFVHHSTLLKITIFYYQSITKLKEGLNEKLNSLAVVVTSRSVYVTVVVLLNVEKRLGTTSLLLG